MASSIVNSNVTCVSTSTVQCPSVNITSEFITLYFSHLFMKTVIAYGLYWVVELVNMVFHLNNACFSVATSPDCTVDKTSAEGNEEVTYNCSVNRLCGNISLTIEEDGSVRAAASDDSVLWRVMASSIINSNVTCVSTSTVQCPSVNVTSKFISKN